MQSTLARKLAQELSTRLSSLLNRAKPLLVGPCLLLLLLLVPYSPRPTHLTSRTDAESAILGRLLLSSTTLQPIPDLAPDVAPSPDALSVVFQSSELCPACEAPIPFSSVRTAVCDNKHEWGEPCFPLSPPFVTGDRRGGG